MPASNTVTISANRHHSLGSAIFGMNGRYKLNVAVTRFDTIVFFVHDAAIIDELTGGSAVIRQAATIQDALSGLDLEREPFNLKPKAGDLAINLGSTPGIVKGQDTLECPRTGQKWKINPEKTLIIRDDRWDEDDL